MKIHYWLRQSLKMVGIIFIACVFYTLLMVLQSENMTWEDVLILTGSFSLMFGMFFSILFSTMLYTQDMPMVISFGGTRKEVILGLQLSRGAYTLLMALCAGALFLIAADIPFADLSMAIPIVLAGFLLFHVLGAIMSILYIKFGKSGIITFGIILLILFVCFIAGAIMGIMDEAEVTLPENFHWILLGAGIVVYALVSLWEARIIRNYNVKM